MAAKPAIVPTIQNQYFWEGANSGQLVVRRCDTCGWLEHPPVAACPNCGARAWKPAGLSGKGTIYTFSIVRRVFHPGFTEDVPYVIALIELQEQPALRILSRIIDCSPDAVEIGMQVEVNFQKAGAFNLPVFRLVPEKGKP